MGGVCGCMDDRIWGFPPCKSTLPPPFPGRDSVGLPWVQINSLTMWRLNQVQSDGVCGCCRTLISMWGVCGGEGRIHPDARSWSHLPLLQGLVAANRLCLSFACPALLILACHEIPWASQKDTRTILFGSPNVYSRLLEIRLSTRCFARWMLHLIGPYGQPKAGRQVGCKDVCSNVRGMETSSAAFHHANRYIAASCLPP